VYCTVNPVCFFDRRQWFVLIVFFLFTVFPSLLYASQELPCLNRINSSDVVLVIDPDGRILYKKNETIKYIPASTLKLLTALSAIHYLGLNYQFRTEFYTDTEGNLKIKGYGDPFLTSEVWQEIADELTEKLPKFKNLIVDNSYFSKNLVVPGVGASTNPYDAPPGALCANFNTVFFDHDQKGRIISAEPQTPMTPFAQKKISSLVQKKGRYTFTHDQADAARYAGELFLYFLNKKGVENLGGIHPGLAAADDKLIHTHLSGLTLNEVIKEMMEFSNNFVANQICIAMGVHVFGPPGTMEKGVRAILDYARKELHMEDVILVEGSGISRKNRISPLDMKAVLERFKPYRHLLKRSGDTFFKTGTLMGIRTRVGYIETEARNPYQFVIFLNGKNSDMGFLMKCLEGISKENE